jgi:lipopolysaccharide transport system permease protein
MRLGRIENPIHDRYFGRSHLTIIEPVRGWQTLDFRELWAYRELLWVLTMRDIKVRYKQTLLGASWAILQPVMTMVVFSIFFGKLAKMPSEGQDYPIFVYAALLPWMFFANAVSSSSSSLIGSASLVNRVYFPRVIIPMASIGTGLLDFLVASSVLLLLMVYYSVPLSVNILLLPALLAVLIVTVCGIGAILSALNVSYRDFRYVVPFAMQLWMFITPVVYPIGIVPENWRWVLYFNPMTGLVEGFRAAFLGKPFHVEAFLISVVVAVALLVVGIAYFKRVERRFADII